VSFSVNSQNSTEKNKLFIEANYLNGKPMNYSLTLPPSAFKTNLNYYDLRIGWNKAGHSPYNYYYKNPSFGLLVNYFNIQNVDTFGNPISISGFYRSPFFYRENFSLNWEIGFGFAGNFSPYDSINNSEMDLISTNYNLHAFLSMIAIFKINENIDILLSPKFLHFSNGALKKPNKGMNLYGIALGARYYLSRNQSSIRPLKSSKPEAIQRNTELDINFSGGIKSGGDVLEDVAPLFFASTLRIDYFWRYHWVGKLGGGLDFFYDESLIRKVNYNPKTYEYMMYGAHIGHELMFGKVSLLFQAGTYYKKHIEAKQWAFLRLGVMSYLSDNIYVAVSMKTLLGFKADYFEVGIGYKANLSKKK
jgi:hypothetical protein